VFRVGAGKFLLFFWEGGLLFEKLKRILFFSTIAVIAFGLYFSESKFFPHRKKHSTLL
jgi:hypothetical protein